MPVKAVRHVGINTTRIIHVNYNLCPNNRTLGTNHNYSFCSFQGVLFKMVIIVLLTVVAIAMIVNIRHEKSNEGYKEYRAELVKEKAKRVDYIDY